MTTVLDCILYYSLFRASPLSFSCVIELVGAGDADGETSPRVRWEFSQLIHLTSNLHTQPSGEPTGMASVIIPIAYLIVIFGGLYAFSVLYRRHIAGKFTYRICACKRDEFKI